ncbi:Uncharacterised protein [Mycobacteroides abscessus subsp. abscessus]|nr:Uncharacterised protein [Mycobacteroides abscessus subsp. abscessus]SKP85352.1 Uncharacterised protein [Mycobacteroides abscessus subsp. abscessus]SKP99668.1 Uncharacterised protein [Mycobacteroides abscessus subsp. abscessus]
MRHAQREHITGTGIGSFVEAIQKVAADGLLDAGGSHRQTEPHTDDPLYGGDDDSDGSLGYINSEVRCRTHQRHGGL